MKPLLLAALPLAAAVLAANAGCTSSADANAKRPAGGAVVIFHHLDKNNDGKVTFAEFDAGFADSIFATYNRDANGSVTHAEWDSIEKADQDKFESSFRALDRNHDGKLTRDELSKHSHRRDAVVRAAFNRIDKNHDGVLTEEEAHAFGINRAADRDPQNHL